MFASLFESLPTRERELKHLIINTCFRACLSLPTRERELKLLGLAYEEGKRASLPTRERELKPLQLHTVRFISSRSPRGSAN